MFVGTFRKQQLIDGGDGFMMQLFEWTQTDSSMDINFKTAVDIRADDWRQAQITIRAGLKK
jgi:hypothetical protein